VITAWEGLVDRANTREGQLVLVPGGADGVGHVAVQLATATGGEGFDVIFDTVGGTTLDESFAAARTYTGHVVSILGWGKHSLAPLSFRGATYSGVFTLLPLLTGTGCRPGRWRHTVMRNPPPSGPNCRPRRSGPRSCAPRTSSNAGGATSSRCSRNGPAARSSAARSSSA
jgi:hypothetical protein